MRLINADNVKLTRSELIRSAGSYKLALEMLLDKIDNAPIIEERPKGEWIRIEDPRYEYDRQYDLCAGVYFICSNCKNQQSSTMGFDFCPKCGADMRGTK